MGRFLQWLRSLDPQQFECPTLCCSSEQQPGKGIHKALALWVYVLKFVLWFNRKLNSLIYERKESIRNAPLIKDYATLRGAAFESLLTAERLLNEQPEWNPYLEGGPDGPVFNHFQKKNNWIYLIFFFIIVNPKRKKNSWYDLIKTCLVAIFRYPTQGTDYLKKKVGCDRLYWLGGEFFFCEQ